MLSRTALLFACVLLAGSLSFQSPAHSAVITNSFVIDPADLNLNEIPSVGLRIRVTDPIGGFTPFQIQAGDIVESIVSFAAPVEFQEFASVTTPLLNRQTFGVTYLSSDPVIGTQEIVRTSTISLTGVTGDFLGTPPPFTNTWISFDFADFNQFQGGEISGSLMSFTGFTITSTILSTTSDIYTYDEVTIGFVDEILVPAPGALALLGIGLIGLGMRRRVA